MSASAVLGQESAWPAGANLAPLVAEVVWWQRVGRRDVWRDVYEGQIRADGTPFRIIRDGEQVGEALGYRDSTKKAIFFFHDAGVMARDRLVDSHSQDGLFVTETHPQ